MKYVDLQVNGYGGVDFNSDALTAESLHAACERLRGDGVTGILATIITDAIDRMTAQLARIARFRQNSPLVREMIWGIHIEGPFINEAPGYVGAHPVEHVCRANTDAMQRLLDSADGLVRLVTLAPERDDGMKVIKSLAAQGILVSAGHCDPSLDELRAAIDAGLSMFTHLGNGCPVTLNRHDNIIQRALSLSDRLTLCFIGDGVHIPYMALRNYLRLAGIDRTIIVTDAIAAAGAGPGRYTIGSLIVEVDENLVTWSADRSHLAGSTATMPQMDAKMRAALDLNAVQMEQLMFRNPRRTILGESH